MAMMLVLIAALIGLVDAHGYLARPVSKQGADEHSCHLSRAEHFQKSSWWLDRAYFDGDRRETPWKRPGKFNWLDAQTLAGGSPQIFHPCGCYTSGSVQTCAAVGTLASHFGATTNGPLGVGNDISPAKWPRGSEQETAFNLHANHAGGYLYTLCPYAEYTACAAKHLPHDENTYLRCVWKCFESNVLQFANGSQFLQYQDDKSKWVALNEKEHSLNTWPVGSTWREIPIADTNQGTSAWNYVKKGPNGHYHFSSPAVRDHFVQDFGEVTCCSPGPKGHNPSNWHIKDRIRVPSALEEGRYLLSWRWDCYMADQIWSNCADVEIVSGSGAPQPLPNEPTPAPTMPPSTTETTMAPVNSVPTPQPEPETKPQPEPEPEVEAAACTDSPLPARWSHNGVYDCSVYFNHGGVAYCAHQEIKDHCCFCRGVNRMFDVTGVAEVPSYKHSGVIVTRRQQFLRHHTVLMQLAAQNASVEL